MNEKWRECWKLYKAGVWTDDKVKGYAKQYFYPMADKLININSSRIGTEKKKQLIQKLKRGLYNAAVYLPHPHIWSFATSPSI